MGIRVDRAFTDVVDIYKPITDDVDGNKRSTGVHYPATPTTANVKCRVEPASDISSPSVAGRAAHDIRITTDVLRVVMTIDIDDTYYVQLKTLGHPERNTWFVVSGGPIFRNWRAGTKTMYIKREKEPRRIS